MYLFGSGYFHTWARISYKAVPKSGHTIKRYLVLRVFVVLLKVASSQKGLMRSSFVQTNELNYFPELEFHFFFFHSKWLKSCALNAQKRY